MRRPLRPARSPAPRGCGPCPRPPAKTSTTDSADPSPTRTLVRGNADAPSHQCTMSTGAPTCTPAGNVDEDRVGGEGVVEPHQGVPALLHGPQHDGRSGHVVGPPEGEIRPGSRSRPPDQGS